MKTSCNLPIRKIKLFTNRIQTEYGGQLPEPGQQYLNRVQSATDRVITMIEGILSYSTLGASGQPVASINLNQILKDIETDLEVIIHQKSAVIKKDMLPDIEGTPILISQLFYNIINNSLKFSDPATPLIISITSGIVTAGGRPWVDITFSDNGIGFDQEYSEKIFNTFTRLNSKDKYEGTGLGLTLCKKIAERHGGTISASGAKGKGASFKVSLPVRQTEKII
jgi:light-regulated signal transduction histidine kinase (bacteriophytochrome)